MTYQETFIKRGVHPTRWVGGGGGYAFQLATGHPADEYSAKLAMNETLISMAALNEEMRYLMLSL